MSGLAARSRASGLKLYAFIGFGLLALALIILGWRYDRWTFDGHRVRWDELLSLILLSFTEDGWFVGKHEGWGVFTVAGATLARLVILSAVVVGGWAIFSRQITAFRLARQKRHVVIVGSTPTAREVALHLEAKRGRFAQVVESEAELVGGASSRCIALPFTLAALEARVALHDAERIVLDTGDVAINIALARATRRRHGGPHISCNIESTHLADEFDELLGIHNDILIYDEARLSVRDCLARHPLYASADRQAAARVHLLIIGFGRLGRVFLEEAVQDSLAGLLEDPLITIVDTDALGQQGLLERDRPAHKLAADIAFLACDATCVALDEILNPHRAHLLARDDRAPITAVALCLMSDDDNIRAAMMLRAARRRTGRFFAPVFMHVRDAEGACSAFLHADGDRVIDPVESVVPIRLSGKSLAVEILAEGERDRIAKRIHQNYLKLADDQAANVSWAALPETYKRANRHVADHLGAKLWSLGLATERRSTDSPLAVDAGWQQAFAGSAPDMEWAARLEHRRWVADRVMEGWTRSARRDDDLRYHPDLVPFDALSAKEREKDRDQNDFVLHGLTAEAARSEGQRFKPELFVGIAAPAEVDALGLAEIDRQIAPLAGLAMDHTITIVASLAPGSNFAAVGRLVAALRRTGSGPRQLRETPEIRLLVPEGVPCSVMLKRSFEDRVAREGQIHAHQEKRRSLFQQFARVEVVRIWGRGYSDDEIFRTPALFEEGLQRANAYLARRTDVLCLLWDGQPSRGPGDLGELAAFRQGAIPAALDPGPSRRVAPRPQIDIGSFVHIEI